MNYLSLAYEWISDRAFVWLLVLGSIAVVLFALLRNKDSKKEKEKAD